MRDDGTRRDVRSPQPPRAVVLIRLLVGLVFFEEGIQKFLFPAVMGAGRFARIGIPAPEVMGPFVGVAEIACGALLMLGLRTRLAAVPLLVDITVAILDRHMVVLDHEVMFHVVVGPRPPAPHGDCRLLDDDRRLVHHLARGDGGHDCAAAQVRDQHADEASP